MGEVNLKDTLHETEPLFLIMYLQGPTPSFQHHTHS